MFHFTDAICFISLTRWRGEARLDRRRHRHMGRSRHRRTGLRVLRSSGLAIRWGGRQQKLHLSRRLVAFAGAPLCAAFALPAAWARSRR